MTALGPSGRVDVRKMLLDELTEETRIRPQRVEAVRPFALLLDTRFHVCEIYFEICLSPRAEGEMGHNPEEYEALEFVTEQRLEKFFTDRKEPFVDLSKAAFRQYQALTKG
jgi:hypothetical protein